MRKKSTLKAPPRRRRLVQATSAPRSFSQRLLDFLKNPAGIALLISVISVAGAGVYFLLRDPETSSSPRVPGQTSMVSSDAIPVPDTPIRIFPLSPTRKSVLVLESEQINLSLATIEWLVDGQPARVDDPIRFKCIEERPGSKIQAKAVIDGKELFSNTVHMVNTPPGVDKAEVIPGLSQGISSFTVEAVGSDLDGDTVELAYEWIVNGEAAGSGKQVERALKKGDKFIVRVTPFDGVDYGNPAVITREIANFPPVIADHREYVFDGKIYTYQAKASDPEGDAFTFSLEPQIDRMTIDPSSGLVTWSVPENFVGMQEVSVLATDSNGGVGRYGLKLSISK